MKRALFGSVVVACALAVAAAWRSRDVALVRLPQPSGPASVGTASVVLELDDAHRRDVVAQVWYPAAVADGRRAPYVVRHDVSLRERIVGALVRTESTVDAPPSAGARPVVVYVPGLGGNRSTNTALLQDLASHGYVAVAIDDTRPGGGFDFLSPQRARASLAWGDAKVERQSADLSRIVDALARLDAVGPFAGRLDLDRLGVLGFSFGGAVAAETARRDRRVRAAVNLDGWMFGGALREGVGKPYFVMGTDPFEPQLHASDVVAVTDEASFDRYNGTLIEAGLIRRGGYFVSIAGFVHDSFTDAAFLPSIRHRASGAIPGERCHRIVARYVRAFFDRYLEHEAAPPLDDRVAVDSAATLRRFANVARARVTVPLR